MACRTSIGSEQNSEEMSTGAIIGTLLGGPMLWACRASHYIRPEATDPEDSNGLPLWRQVRSVELSAEAYCEVLGVTVDELRRGRGHLQTLEALMVAHRKTIGIVERDHRADVGVAYVDVMQRQAVSAAECNLLFGWLVGRLEIFYDFRFVLARRPVPGLGPLPEVEPAMTIRSAQPNWGPPSHVVLFVSTSPNVKRLVDCCLPRPVDLLVAHSRPERPTSPDAGGEAPQTTIFRVVKQPPQLYSIDQLLDFQWTSVLLFDARISRPHTHFVHHAPMLNPADQHHCVDVDALGT